MMSESFQFIHDNATGKCEENVDLIINALKWIKRNENMNIYARRALKKKTNCSTKKEIKEALIHFIREEMLPFLKMNQIVQLPKWVFKNLRLCHMVTDKYPQLLNEPHLIPVPYLSKIIKFSPSKWQYVKEYLKKNKLFLKNCIDSNIQVFAYVEDNLKDESLCHEVLGINGKMIQYVPLEWHSKKIYQLIIKENVECVEFLKVDLMDIHLSKLLLESALDQHKFGFLKEFCFSFLEKLPIWKEKKLLLSVCKLYLENDRLMYLIPFLNMDMQDGKNAIIFLLRCFSHSEINVANHVKIRKSDFDKCKMFIDGNKLYTYKMFWDTIRDNIRYIAKFKSYEIYTQ